MVGAGALGLAVAWRLAELNAGTVLVLEKEAAIGRGSTARANGGIRAQFGTAINIRFSLFSQDVYQRLQSTVPPIGLKHVGYLFMAGTVDAEAALRRNFELQQALGIGTRWLSPEEVLQRAPYVRPDGLRAGTFRDQDGILDPAATLARLAIEARRAGARIRFDAEVQAMRRRGSTIELRTPQGDVAADVVVNCAGPYATQVAALLDVELPVTPVRRNLACTEPISGIPEVIPMCVDLDTGLLIRREGAGVLVAYSNPNDPPSWDTSFDESFLDDIARLAGNRFPFLETARINPRKCWAGLYPETPDHQPIIGATGEDGNFAQCVGFGGHGLMHAPAAGQAVAELVTAGISSTFDLKPFRPERFREGQLDVEPAIL